MKFEKFFKTVGIYGLIVKKSDTVSWLICGGVGMRIPEGVNKLGVSVDPTPLFKAIVNSEPEVDGLRLVKAILDDPQGKANDIIRVFENDLGDRVGICNKDYGLLENFDRINYLEIEDEYGIDHKIMVVSDRFGDVIGYITGVSVY